MNDVPGRQAGFNALSRGQWANFAGHRRVVAEVLGNGKGRLCVLGVGNGNDLDLKAILKKYREVHLVDLDAEALANGVARQGFAGQSGLVLHGGLDLTGMVPAFARWTPETEITSVILDSLIQVPEALVCPALPGPFDVVASTCLLSQLIGNAFHAVGDRHPRFLEVVRAIRAGHLRLLTALSAPGGSAVLITDVVSSETVADLGSIPESDLKARLRDVGRTRNHFYGVNPDELMIMHERDPVLKERVAGREAIGPWRWNLHDRVYLVFALRYAIRSGFLRP